MNVTLKCQKCRSVLIEQTPPSILNVHGALIEKPSNSVNLDCAGNIIDVWYIPEVDLPEWIMDSINEADWQKGKLKCPQCSLKVGSFDFISGLKCSCKKHILPAIHLVKSKCDVYTK